MIGLKKICSIAVLCFPMVCMAQESTDKGPLELPSQTTEAQPSTPVEVTISTITEEAKPAKDATVPLVEPSETTTQEAPNVVQQLLARARAENARRASMRGANLTETECLAMAMYHEARGEGERGMKAVAFVIHNRSRDSRFPSNICEVVRQRSQFSFVSDRNPDNIREWGIYERVLAIAVELLDNGGFQRTKSPVGNALFFNSFKGRAAWAYARASRFIGTIGNHHFFK